MDFALWPYNSNFLFFIEQDYTIEKLAISHLSNSMALDTLRSPSWS